MFKLDIFNNPQPLNIYLVNINGDILGCINDIIDESSASLHIICTQQYELNFDIIEKQDNIGWYEYLHEGMYLYVDSVGIFKLNQPTISYDGITEKKSIVAYSVDSELEDKTTDISINMGTKESLEYLVEYESNETEELINPYTGVPYDWIVLYNTFPEQLNNLKNKYDEGYFGTPETISINGESTTQIVVTDSEKIDELSEIFKLIPRLLNKITYVNNQDGSKDSILTEYVIIEYDPTDAEIVISYTLTSGFRGRIVELITFYSKYRNQLSLLSLVLENTGWKIGTIYGLSQDDYSLCNKKFQFEINETIYSFFTQSFSKVSESIVTFDMIERKVNITPINQFGNDTGIVMGYDTLVNSLSISTDDEKLTTRLYVSGGDDLDITRVNFGSNYIDNLNYLMNVTDSNGNRIYVSNDLYEKYTLFCDMRDNLREVYINKSIQYENNLQKIDELKYRLPNDGLKTDWGTYTLEELKASLTAYKNLLVTLISLYKEDYGTAGLNNDGSINENYIKNTEYWWDYEAYKNIIIEIECAIDVFPYYDDSSKWTASQKTQYESQIKAWETEWSLYGITELEAKISTYEQNMKLMLDGQESKSAVIKKNDGSDWGIKTWAELNDDEKSMYGYSELLYRYDIYMQYYNNMVSAKTYLATLKTQLETLEAEQETLQSDLNTITNQVQFSSYFTEKECESLYHLLRDSDYSNDNIFVTSIDTVPDKYDRMSELLNDAKEQLSIYARPQLNFSIESENLLALPEFEPMWSQFIPGNYVYVQYKDSGYVKLRLIGYTFNPCLPSSKDLQLEFSNFLLSTSTYNDWASLLGNNTNSSRRSSGGSSSGSGSGSYGDMDDVDVTISNTLLTKLLKSETFGTRVTNVILDTIDANKLTARLATFGGLADGTTTIDGNCIQTGYIIDSAYRHEVDVGNVDAGDIDNTAGTIINLETGEFNFGGGKLVFDGNDLTVSGTIIADAGQIGDFTLANGALYTGQKTTDGTNVQGIRLSASELNLSGGTALTTVKLGKGTINIGGKLTYDSTNGLVLDGNLTATNGIITGATLSGAILTGDAINITSSKRNIIHTSGTSTERAEYKRQVLGDDNGIIYQYISPVRTINTDRVLLEEKLEYTNSYGTTNYYVAGLYLDIEKYIENTTDFSNIYGRVLLRYEGNNVDNKIEMTNSGIVIESLVNSGTEIGLVKIGSCLEENTKYTTFELTDNKYLLTGTDGSWVAVVKKLGWCQVFGVIKIVQSIDSSVDTSQYFEILDSTQVTQPQHERTIHTEVSWWGSSYTRPLRLAIDSHGGLKICRGTDGGQYGFSITYPVHYY